MRMGVWGGGGQVARAGCEGVQQEVRWGTEGEDRVWCWNGTRSRAKLSSISGKVKK